MKTHSKTLDNFEAYETQKIIAPPLDDEFYAQSYELRKAASTMTVAAIDWFRNNLTPLLEGSNYSLSSQDKTLSVLSIGSGEGDIDLEIINSLTPKSTTRWKNLKYVALEPNSIHRDRFLQRLEKASLGDNVEVSVQREYFEPGKFDDEKKYDLVILTHVLYYFDDALRAIESALKQTKEGGEVIIVHQTATGIPQIQHEYMLEAKGNSNEMLSAEEIRALLDSKFHQHQYHHVDARLDVTQCLQGTENGVKIMSFCMECDLRQLPEAKFTKILQGFWRLAEIEDSGKAFINEPIGVVVLSAPSVTIQDRVSEDLDPVIDYWQLAKGFDWAGIFLSQYHRSKNSSFRLLDVACGTGRWLKAFPQYIQLDGEIKEVVYDCLDPSATAIAQASQKLFSPLKQGNQHVSTIQKANIESNAYDLLWSMHGFYNIPTHDLPEVLTKCASLLNDTGVGFIALGTRKSFYVDFYEQYLQAFKDGKGVRFTSAEDVIKAMEACGIEHQVHKVFYEEPIKAEDAAGLEHYIKNEATVNCFNKDKQTEKLSDSKSITLEELWHNPQMETYLNSLRRNFVYYFPEEIWLIAFGNIGG